MWNLKGVDNENINIMSSNLSISCFYQNVRGLRGRVEEFYLSVLDCVYDILIITESWLHSGIHSGELFDKRYTVYRADRKGSPEHNKRGGGVIVAIKNIYCCEEIRLNASYDDDGIDYIILKVGLIRRASDTFYLGAFYFPPCTPREHYLSIYEDKVKYHLWVRPH